MTDKEACPDCGQQVPPGGHRTCFGRRDEFAELLYYRASLERNFTRMLWVNIDPQMKEVWRKHATEMRPVETTGWQSIETAPLDGSQVLVIGTLYNMLVPNPHRHVAAYQRGWWSGRDTLSHVTHWMPLPRAPGLPVEPMPAEARDDAAFEAGWRAAAEWAKRDDLVHDIDSPAYRIDRFNRLKRLAVEPKSTQPPDSRGDAALWVLAWLAMKGGLGSDVHDVIEAVMEGRAEMRPNNRVHIEPRSAENGSEAHNKGE